MDCCFSCKETVSSFHLLQVIAKRRSSASLLLSEDCWRAELECGEVGRAVRKALRTQEAGQ